MSPELHRCAWRCHLLTRSTARIAAAGALLLAVATPAAAELTHRRTIPDFRASSLAYDAVICGVWVASEGPTLILLNAFGAEIRRIEGGLPFVRSLTVEGDALLVTDGWGRFARVSREGTPIDAPFRLSETLRDTEGLHRDADGSFLIVEDDPARLLRIAPDGGILMEIDGHTLEPPMTEPQGITRDPYSGNILVVDDNEGLNSLFELAPDGSVLTVTPLSPYGFDAEGVALQPETGTLFVGFDSGRALAIFEWQPSQTTIDIPLERGPDCAIM
jgi:hypothetical protein